MLKKTASLHAITIQYEINALHHSNDKGQSMVINWTHLLTHWGEHCNAWEHKLYMDFNFIKNIALTWHDSKRHYQSQLTFGIRITALGSWLYFIWWHIWRTRGCRFEAAGGVTFDSIETETCLVDETWAFVGIAVLGLLDWASVVVRTFSFGLLGSMLIDFPFPNSHLTVLLVFSADDVVGFVWLIYCDGVTAVTFGTPTRLWCSWQHF